MSLKKVIFAICLCLPVIGFAQQQKLEGTTWVGRDGTKQLKYEMTFLSDQTYQFSYYDEKGEKVLINGNGVAKGNWRLTGSTIYMETNNKFSERNGTINGDSMSGIAKNQKGVTWSWSYKKTNSFHLESDAYLQVHLQALSHGLAQSQEHFHKSFELLFESPVLLALLI
jgi:hypothetical protein